MCFRASWASQTSLLFDLQRQRLSHEQASHVLSDIHQMLCSLRITKQKCSSFGNLMWIASSHTWCSCIVIAWKVDGCLGLHPPLQKNFSRNGATWCMAEFCLGLRLAGSHTFCEGRGTQGCICKVRCQKTESLSRNSTNYLFFLITRNLHLWLPLVYHLINNPWEKPLTHVLIWPLVFRWVLIGVQLE